MSRRTLAEPELQKVLLSIRQGKLEAVEPYVDFDEGVKYPHLEELAGSREAAASVLEKLLEKEILRGELLDNLMVCPVCGGHRLVANVACPMCGSKRIIKSISWEHEQCGHVDFAERFKSEGRLVCPGCGAVINQSDCKVHSILYSCDSCGASFSNPKEMLKCDMGHVFTLDEAHLQPLMVYKVNPEKKMLLERLTVDFEELLKPFTDMGMRLVAPLKIRGTTGVMHEVPFALFKNNAERPYLVGTLNLESGEQTVEDVLALWAKSIDIQSEKTLYLSVPGLNGEAKKTAKSLGIEIVEAKNLTELKKQIKQYAQNQQLTEETT